MNVPAQEIKLPFQHSFGLITDPTVLLLSSGRKSVTEGGPSDSPVFWLNSGAEMITTLGRGNTLQGEQSPDSEAFRHYADNADTEFGKFPQSLFRLYTRQKFLDSSCSVIYRMNHYHLTDRPTRQASNGLLVMSRATPDGSDSYYAGQRVDGLFICKRKKAGVYTTLFEKKVLLGTYNRDSETNANLIPLGAWVGIKLTTLTLPNGHVKLTFYRDMYWSGIWSLVGSVEDSNPIAHAGLHALRTDYSSCTFDNFRIEAA